jgi:membrane protease YdiL (CAAX protease family)
VLTTIGQPLQKSPRKLVLCSLIGAAVVATDHVPAWHAGTYTHLRGVLQLSALASYLIVLKGDSAAVGLQATPVQGWLYWLKVTAVTGFFLVTWMFAMAGSWHLLGGKIPDPMIPPSDLGPALLQYCVLAPLFEEGTYRLALCTPAAVLLRPWGAIVTSGVLFGTMHVVSGNSELNSLIVTLPGFFLAWAYLKSGTIMVPVVLHAVGNLCLVTLQVVAWYCLYGVGA